jgi:hypothetical protein
MPRDGQPNYPAWWRRQTQCNAWSQSELVQLRDLACEGLSPRQIATCLKRTESAVRNKALLHGISFPRRSVKEA